MDPYSDNPFRVLGLRSDASSKEIARASGRLLQWLEIGEKPQVEEPLPFLRTVRRDRESIKQAVGLIENPRDRIQQELFWPAAGNSHFQSCCEHLKHGRYAEFVSLCEYAISKVDTREGSGKPTDFSERLDASLCRHFLAILFHSATTSGFEVGYPATGWLQSFQCWKMVFQDDVFWEYIASRVRHLNDPRLAGFDVSQLRQELPRRLLEVNILLGLAGLEQHRHKQFVEHALVIKISPFSLSEQERALRKLADPLVRQFQKALNEITPLLSESSVRERTSSLRQKPTGGFEGVIDPDKFMEYFSFVKAHIDKKMIPIAELVQKADLGVTVGGLELLDNLAYTLRRFSLAANNVGDVPQKALELTKTAKTFARSPECTQRLKEDETALQFLILQKEAVEAADAKQYDKAILKLEESRKYATPEEHKTVGEWIEATKKRAVLENVKPIDRAPTMSTMNGIGTTLYGKRDFDKATQTYIATLFFVVFFIPLFPFAAYRVRHVGGNQYQFFGRVPLTKWAFLPPVLIVVLILFMIISNSLDSSTSSSSESPPTDNRQQYSTTPAVPQNSFGTPQYSPPISSGKAALSEWLYQESKRLNAEASELDTLRTDIERERAVLRSTYNMLGETPTQDDADNYNAMADRFDTKVARFKSLRDQFLKDAQKFKSEEQRYNSMP